MDDLERRLLVEQTRKEVLDEIKEYEVGFAVHNQVVLTKTGDWNGYLFVIPDEKYNELFEPEKHKGR